MKRKEKKRKEKSGATRERMITCSAMMAMQYKDLVSLPCAQIF